MRIFKRRKKVVARTSHVHKKLLGRKGTPVNARIISYPVRRFDDAYLGHEPSFLRIRKATGYHNENSYER